MQDHWYDLEEIFQKNARKEQVDNGEFYQQQKSKRMSKFFDFLATLGFAQGKIPTIKHIYDSLEARMAALEKTGVTVLRPRFVFRKDLGTSQEKYDYIYLKYGEFIPPGYKPVEKTIPEEEFHKMVAAGFYSVGDCLPIEFLQGYNFLMTIHDLAHFYSFLKYPEIMGVLKHLSQNYNPKHFSYFMAFETWGVLYQEDRASLANILEPVVKSPQKDFLKLTEVEQQLSKTRSAKLMALGEALAKFVASKVDIIGGEYADVLYYLHLQYLVQFKLHTSPEKVFEDDISGQPMHAHILYRTEHILGWLKQFDSVTTYVLLDTPGPERDHFISYLAQTIVLADALTKMSKLALHKSMSPEGLIADSEFESMLLKTGLMRVPLFHRTFYPPIEIPSVDKKAAPSAQ